MPWGRFLPSPAKFGKRNPRCDSARPTHLACGLIGHKVMVPVQTNRRGAAPTDVASPKTLERKTSWENRVYAFLAFVIALTAAFGVALWELFSTCYRSDLN